MSISITARALRLSVALTGALAALCGCSTLASDELVQAMDPHTAVTLLKLPEAVAFTGAQGGSLDARMDALIGPVAVDTMGAYTYYLYVSAQRYDNLQPGYAPGLRLFDGERVIFERRPGSSVQAPLSRAPYAGPLSARSQFYYAISETELARLEVSGTLGLAVSYDNRQWTRLLPWDGPVVNFNRFISQVSPQ